MRLLVVLLALTITEILGIGVYGLPATAFYVSLLPLSLVAGWMAHKEKR